MTPNGTITLVIDRKLGVLRAFSEQDPDPEDWKIACQYVRRVGGVMQGAWAEGEVDVFQISLAHAAEDFAAGEVASSTRHLASAG